ncbi:DUF7064 domain-containing protein [Nonomuraea cavernae]|uniref:DUF7064 domain-containing protein n=1 Tax=Nonomuraea cavernae TaxID=2045107 RepID=UPI0033E5CB23
MRIVDMGGGALGPGDEGPHQPGPDLLWNESYYLDFVSEDGELGGYVRLGLYPNWGRAWYWACLAGADGRQRMIVDHDVKLPTGADLDVSGDGYTATQRTVEPMEAVRLTLAADDLHLDLEWRTAGGVYGYGLTSRYEIPCRVSGTVGGRPFDGHGQRDHSWGVRDWWSVSWLWSSGRLEDGTYLHGMQANVGVALPWPAFTVPPDGQVEHVEGFSAATEFAGDRPSAARLAFPGLGTTVEPLADAPVELISPDGTLARFSRSMCRFVTDDGRVGHGWTEWHQPPGWREHGWGPLL